MTLRARLIRAALVFGGVVVLGVAGYLLIEPEYGLLDAIYMTVITVASVGYGEVHPLDQGGRIFTIFLIFAGSGTLLYGISTATAFVVEGELKDLLRRRRMEKRIAALRSHHIVCGVAGAGRYAAEELIRTQRPVVVIDTDEMRCGSLAGQDRLAWIAGDPTSSEVLRAAGIDRAAGLVSALETDKDNVFAVLTARDLNATMRIVALAVEPESDHKLRVAGANEVVLPNMIGGMRVASVLIRPTVVTFLDSMLRDRSQTLRVEEAPLPAGSPSVGRAIEELAAIRENRVLVVALRRAASGVTEFNPPSATALGAGDTLLVMGEVAAIGRLRAALGSPPVANAADGGTGPVSGGGRPPRVP